MIFVKILIDIICAFLNFLGGAYQHNYRRYVMPVVLGGGISLSSVWWLGLTTLPVMGILSIGYGDNSALRRFLGNAGARGMWLFLVAIGIGFGPWLTGHLHWYFYVPYFLIAGVLGATLRNINQIIGDLIEGAFLALIIFIIN